MRRLRPYDSGAGFAFPKFELEDSKLITVPFAFPKGFARLRIVQAFYQTYWNQKRFRNRYELNSALLDRFRDNAQTQNFIPAVIFLPGKSDTEEDKERRGFVNDWAKQNGIPFADLTTPIHSAGVEQLYIKKNWHWNPEGHRVAAEALHRFVKRELTSD